MLELAVDVRFDLLKMFFQKKEVSVKEICKKSGLNKQQIYNFARRSSTLNENPPTCRITGNLIQKIAEGINEEPGKFYQELIWFERDILFDLNNLIENYQVFVDSSEQETKEIIFELLEGKNYPKETLNFFVEYMVNYSKANKLLLESGLDISEEGESE